MATIKDIANQLGLSVTTVSKGLSGASDVNEETRQKILDTALELGYVARKDQSASNAPKICIFVENIKYEHIEQFGYEIIVGFRLAAAERKWKIDILPLSMNERIDYIYDEFMRKNGYSGGFLLGFFLHSDFHVQLQKTVIPTVTLDNVINNRNVACVGVDNLQGIMRAVELLASLGHSTIALMNGESNSRVSQERYNGFKLGMSKCNLPVRKELIAFGNYTNLCAEPYVKGFVEAGATAIVCASDVIAHGVLTELNKLDLRVPQDISVVGFDDMPLAKYTNPPLTTIRQDRLSVGKSACVAMEQIMDGIAVSRLLISPELIIRESTGPVR